MEDSCSLLKKSLSILFPYENTDPSFVSFPPQARTVLTDTNVTKQFQFLRKPIWKRKLYNYTPKWFGYSINKIYIERINYHQR